jgi:glycosyltransferase involved in cell wall biosynthesis
MKKYSILLVSPFPPPFGGIARYSEDLYAGFIKAGLTVKKYNTARYERWRLHNADKKRNYIRVFQFRNIFFLLAVFFDFIPFSFTLLFRSINIVHVHTSSYWGWWRSILYIIIARICKVKTILHIHNAIDRFYFEESGKIGKYFISRSLQIPDHLVTLSEGIKKIVATITTTPITPIYNGIEVGQFQNHKVYKKPFKILFAGFVGTQKGVPDLLNGLRKSGLTPEEIALTVMGAGDIEDMKRMAEKLGIQQYVRFTGRVSEEEKISLYRSHHIFALPSYGEGQPLSILEGMAAGMAVISTPVGSIPEVIQDGQNGYLIQPGDVEGIGQIFHRLMDSKLLETMGNRNRETAREKYAFSRVVGDNISVYKKLIGN